MLKPNERLLAALRDLRSCFSETNGTYVITVPSEHHAGFEVAEADRETKRALKKVDNVLKDYEEKEIV